MGSLPRSARASFAAAVLLSLLPAASARAQAEGSGPSPTDADLAEAQHSFEVGMQAFDGGDYETATSEFRDAYELTHYPDLLFNVYLSEERSGHLAEAADALAGYLDSSASIEAPQRALLERRLERLRARVAAHESASAPTEADDGSPQQPIRSTLGAPAAASPEPTPPPDGAHAGGGGPPVAAIALFVTAGVLVAAFGVLAGLSEAEDQRLASDCGRDVGRVCTDAQTSTLLALDVAADASWITAAVAGVTGLVLLFALPSEGGSSGGGGSDAVQALVAPWIAPTGAGFALRARL